MKMQNYDNKQIVIALAADLNYSEQVITLIKSVCYHHQNVKFYLLNKEYSIEWFNTLNKKLNQINCLIVDAKIELDIFDNILVSNRITSPTCYRYFIPELPEERILYLDSDIIVDGALSTFYKTDFKDNLLVAIEDFYLNLPDTPHYYKEFPNMKPYFNAGVLLINNTLWRSNNITDILIKYTFEHRALKHLDQDVLNIVLKNKWLPANPIYNYQIGALKRFAIGNMFKEFDKFQNIKNPRIIHFTEIIKPWVNPNLLGINDKFYLENRERYWFYYQLEWSDIIKRHQ